MMDGATIIDVSSATWRYLILYAGTLFLHVVFMNYVLAGTAYVAICSIVRPRTAATENEEPAAQILRDWLPFILSAAITAGVGPLLFIQILYQRDFYSAQLLSPRHWLTVMFALIVGFYLLYVQKTRWISSVSALLRSGVSVVAFACFLWTAYAWTRNHLLSIHPELWPDVYASRNFQAMDLGLLPRLGTWVFGAFPVMCCGLAWQVHLTKHRLAGELPSTTRRLAIVALAGLFLSVVCAVAYSRFGNANSDVAILGPRATPLLAFTATGILLQVLVWIASMRMPNSRTLWLVFLSVGAAITILGTIALRESIRLRSVDLESMRSAHAQAAQAGGFAVFLAVFVINLVAIAVCAGLAVRVTRQERKSTA